MMSEPSSNISQQPSAFFDPELSSWKTSQASLPFPGDQVEDSMSLQRLPDWGTTADGVLFEQGMPERLTAVRDGSASLGTPRAFLANFTKKPLKIRNQPRGNLEEQIAALLPTPVVNDMGAGKTVEQWDSWTAEIKAKHGNSNGHGPSLSVEAARLLPTPRARDWKDTGANMNYEALAARGTLAGSAAMLSTPVADDSKNHGPTGQTDWGKYGATISRWEDTIGREPPPPTDERGLLPKFVEWMMGLPEGWVCDLGLPRTAELKALGNGVVPQQAALALQLLHPNT